MSNVGRGPSGYVYTGKPGLPPSFLEIGTNSGLTDHGVVLAQGADAFVATSPGTAGQVLMSNGAGADPSFQTGGSTIPNTLTGNTGGPISPSGGNINTVGTGSITIAGSGDTLTTQLTGLTDHAVLVGAGTATITKVGPVASTGAMLQSNGLASDPGFSTSTWPATTTINQILYSSAANTVAGLATANNGVLITSNTGVPSMLANGTTGQLLTATTGAPPSWTTVSSGDVSGPGSSTDRAIATWNGTGGTALFDNSTVKIDSSGRQTNTTQPAFLSVLNTEATDVAGNSGSYTFGTGGNLTDIFDQNSNMSTSGVFTAPVTGKYFFTFTLRVIDVVNSTNGNIQIVTSNRTYTLLAQNPLATLSSSSGWKPTGSSLTDMDAADTATFTLSGSGEASNVWNVIASTTNPTSWVSGFLAC